MDGSSSQETVPCLRLPNELLDQIAVHLDKRSLYNLALTCKKLRSSSDVSLYHTYENRYGNQPFLPFVRTLCQRPEVAKHVNTINIRAWKTERRAGRENLYRMENLYGIQQIPPAPSSGSHFRLFSRAAVRLGVITDRNAATGPDLSVGCNIPQARDCDFIRLLQNGIEGSHVLLMLALIPNLKALTVRCLTGGPRLDLYRFLLRSTTALRQVTSITLMGDFNAHFSGLSSYVDLDFLHLCPLLHSLELQFIGFEAFSPGLESLSTRRLTCVHLRSCDLGIRVGKSILKGQRLESLMVQSSMREDGFALPSGLAPLSMETILSSLNSSRDTLKDLCYLGLEDDDEIPFTEFPNMVCLSTSRMGLFSYLSKNVEDSVRMNHLYDRLPVSLRRLKLTHVRLDPDVFKWLECLAILKRKQLVNITAVTIVKFSRRRENRLLDSRRIDGRWDR